MGLTDLFETPAREPAPSESLDHEHAVRCLRVGEGPGLLLHGVD
jgi:hypothetical protein